ncbi:MAG: ribonuclease P protein component [Lentisphaeria bacterium]|nr:ribonuclease P protein component [Lentisphaeria bacterium]
MKTFESLRCRSEFDKVKQIGRRESSGLFTMLWVPESEELRRCGIICSRKFDVRAVKRNRARRLVREALRLIGAEAVFPCSLVIIPRRSILKVKMPTVKNALESSLRRAGILIPSNQDVSPSHLSS